VRRARNTRGGTPTSRNGRSRSDLGRCTRYASRCCVVPR
jgi:hypothetical protein